MKSRRSWSYINPTNKKPRKLGVVVAFDIETRQIPLNEKISTFTVKEKSELIFGTACAYIYNKLGKKKKISRIKSDLGFFDKVEDYYLFDELFFDRKEQFTKWLLKLSKKFYHVYVYAHNITFDLRESVDFDLLRKNGYEISVFNPASKQFIIRFERQKAHSKWRITFTDTLNLYPAPLEEVGNTIGLPKLEKELGLDRRELEKAIEEGRWSDVLKYNVRDTQITASAVIIREKVVNRLGGQLRITNPSTAMDLFRRKFLKKGIKKPSAKLRKFMRKAYFGGRTEVFFRGIVATPRYKGNALKLYRIKKEKYKDYGFLETESLHYVDVNSMYSYSMKYFPSPVKEIGYYGEEGIRVIKDLYKLGIIIEFDVLDPLKSIYEAWKKQLRWIKNERPNIDWEKVEKKLEEFKNDDRLFQLKKYFVYPVLYILEATVHVERKPITETITPLPVKMNGKLVFPQGVFTGIWTQFELSLINPPKDTRILEVHSVVLFEADWLFIEYIDTFYNMKNEAKKKGDPVMYQVSKLFMTSLYGKWAEMKKVSVLMSKEEFAKFIIEKTSEMKNNLALEVAYDMDYGVMKIGGVRVNCIGGYYEIRTEEYVEPYSISIAVFITSIARSVLREYMYLIKKEKGMVFYSDTDSLIVDKRGFEALKPFIDKYRLGYLDEEIPNIAFVEINTLKDYKVFVPKKVYGEIIDHEDIGYIKKILMKVNDREKVSYYYFDDNQEFWVKYKLKGVSLSKARSISDKDDSLFKMERLVGVREFLKYKQFGLYWIEQEKELTRVYDKAESADGWVVPFNL